MKPAAIKPEIQFDTFASVDIRVGTIQSIHDVAASSKLVRLVVDFGDHTRNILAGTANGLRGWWTREVDAEERQGGIIRFTFGGDFHPQMDQISLDTDRTVVGTPFVP
jgi:hypothetical protein